jgi:NDP-sugar pyrophosphorylase family protein
MGIYVLEPTALPHVPDGARFDIPDLVHALLAAGEPVGSYVHEGDWRDIGRHDDYEAAAAEIDDMLPELLP